MSRPERTKVPPLNILEVQFDEVRDSFQKVISAPLDKLPSDNHGLESLYAQCTDLHAQFASLYSLYFSSLKKAGALTRLQQLRTQRRALKVEYEEYKEVLDFALQAAHLPVLPNLDISLVSPKSTEPALEKTSYFEAQSTPSEGSVQDLGEYRDKDVTRELNQLSTDLGRLHFRERIMPEPVISETSQSGLLSLSGRLMPELLSATTSHDTEPIMSRSFSLSRSQLDGTSVSSLIPMASSQLSHPPRTSSVLDPSCSESSTRQDVGSQPPVQPHIPTLGISIIDNENFFSSPGATGLDISSKSDFTADSYTGPATSNLLPTRLDVSSTSRHSTYLDTPALNNLRQGLPTLENYRNPSTSGVADLVYSTKSGFNTDSYSGPATSNLLPTRLDVSSTSRHSTYLDTPALNNLRQGLPTLENYRKPSTSGVADLVYPTKSDFKTDFYTGSDTYNLPRGGFSSNTTSRFPINLDPPKMGENSNLPLYGITSPSFGLSLTSAPEPSTGPRVYFPPEAQSQPPHRVDATGHPSQLYKSSTYPAGETFSHQNLQGEPPAFLPSNLLGPSDHTKNQEMQLRESPGSFKPPLEFPHSTISCLLPPPMGFTSNEPTVAKDVLSSSLVRGKVERNQAFLPANSNLQVGPGREYGEFPGHSSSIPANSGYSLLSTKPQVPSTSCYPLMLGEEYKGIHAGNTGPSQDLRYPTHDPIASSASSAGLFVPRPPTFSPNNVDSNKKFFESFLGQAASSKTDYRPIDNLLNNDSKFNNQNFTGYSHPNFTHPPMATGSYPPFYHPFYPPYPYPYPPYPPHPQPNAQFEALTKHLLEVEMVKTSKDKFEGKAYKFWPWFSKMKEQLSSVNLLPQQLVLVLQSNVSGKPREFIADQMASTGEMTMDDINNLLIEMIKRFGSPQQISKELNELIAKFPPISGKNQSEQLLGLVDLCKIILHNQPRCSELAYLDCASGLLPLRAKLPDHIQRAWSKEGHSYGARQGGSHPPFQFFVKFLKEQADLYSDESFRIVSQSPASSTSRKQVKVLATKLQSSTDSKENEVKPNKSQYCLHHKSETHGILQCNDLKRMGQENPNKRRDRILKLGLCLKCLGRHSADNCKVKVACEVCGYPHATILHIYRRFPKKPSKSPTVESESADTRTNEEDSSSNTDQNSIPSPRVLCTNVPDSRESMSCSKTLLVEITMSQVSEKSMLAYAIIDEQCNSTLVDTRVLDFFELDFPSADFSIKFATQDCEERTSGKYVTGLQVKGMLTDEIIPIPEALSCSNLADTTQEVASPELVRKHRLISQFAKHFPEFQPKIPVLLIIGRNCGRAMATECLTTVEPYVHKTPLGYSLVGNVGVQSPSNEVRVLRSALERDHPVEVKYNFTKRPSENFDTYATYPDDEHPGYSYEDKKFMSEMVSKICINDKNNIELPLPLKNTELPQNKAQVFQRTRKTLQNLQKDPEKLQQCIQSVEKSIQKEYIEPVPPHEIDNPPHQTWYLPIFPVGNKNKAPRLVYDASAKYHGISLNDALLQGPDLNNQLRSVLLRFREQPIAFAADIEAMFNNYAVPSDQTDLQRFFWYKNNDPTKDLVPYRSTRHIFGCVSSPAVSTCGLKYCADQLPDGDEAKDYLDKNFYVDDGLHSTSSAVSAIEVLTKTMSLLKTYNMKLHKVISNSQEVLDAFPGAVKTTSITTLPSEGGNTAALGVQWNTENDNFLLIPNLPSRPFSKRGILSTINSLFDPIGIASPVILYGRIMQRQILQNNSNLEKYGWDDLLPSQYFDPWSNWLHSLDQLSNFQIPRSFYPEGFTPSRQELHVFCDASEHAIGHVNYLRSIDHAGTCHVGFVSASSKLAPKTATSIPRLELNAAVEACKSANKIMTDLRYKPNAIYFHSDSQIVLGYLNNLKRRFSKYVERRINVIHNLFPDAHWFYIGTKDNPADHASRPSTPPEVLSSNWLRGPDLLWDSSYDPESNSDVTPFPTILPEEEREVSILSTKVRNPSPFSNLFSKINSFPKLVNIFSCILRFARVLDRVRQKNGCLENPRPVEVSNQEARATLIRVVQTECFFDEIKKLKSGIPLSDTHQLSNLAPSVDKIGLLRVGGRLKHSDVDFSVKHPILIPQNHPLSSTIIQYFHKLNKHQGSLITHNSIIQNGYHIQNGRTLIRNFLKSCVTCRKLRGKPSEQIMADLPPHRLVENIPPFTHVGIDVFGPFYIHDGKGTRANSGTKKIWALIVVCLPSRAIHLEYLSGMDTSSFRNAFNRFRAIRGPCLTIRSDQGTNFVLARKQMEAVDISSFSKELQAEGIQWTFNSPHASHQGGCWERKIGSVRRVLEATFKLISNRGVSRDEFITFLAEAASIVNSTPLWTPSNDPNDPSPLTPQMLLTLRRADEFHTLDDYTPEDILSYGPKRYRRVQYLASQFWQRWRKEYLHTLTMRQKWRKPSPSIQEGDLVLIKDKNLARNHWPMARVRSTKPSSDGLIRNVTLTLPPLPGRTNMRSLDRAIQDLVLLVPTDPN